MSLQPRLARKRQVEALPLARGFQYQERIVVIDATFQHLPHLGRKCNLVFAAIPSERGISYFCHSQRFRASEESDAADLLHKRLSSTARDLPIHRESILLILSF